MQQPASSQGSLQKTMLIAKYGERDNFLKTYNPDYQREIVGLPEKCFFGDYPTLAQIVCYGKNMAVVWLVPQLFNLSEYCGCKEKMTAKQIEECAFTISTEFHYLKVSEFMLFFHRFKSGRYGRFYGSVDPLVIMTSLREFLKERGTAYDEHYQEAKRFNDAGTGITWDDYCKMKGITNRPSVIISRDAGPVKTHIKERPEDILRMANQILTEKSKDVVENFGNVFKKKYGCTPAEYVNKYMEVQK